MERRSVCGGLLVDVLALGALALSAACGGASAGSESPAAATAAQAAPLDFSNTLCVQPAIASNDLNEQTRCLLQVTDTDELFASLNLHDALAAKLGTMTDRLGEPAVNAVLAEVDRSFATAHLQGQFEARVVASINAEQTRALLDYYATEPGRRYAAMSASEPNEGELEAWIEADELSAPRRALIDRLRLAAQIPQAVDALVSVPMRGMTQAMMPLAPPGATAPTDAQLQEAVAPVVAAVDKAMTLTLAFVLRETSDEELAAIVTAEETPAAQSFTTARSSALSAVLGDAYRALGTAIATNTPANNGATGTGAAGSSSKPQ